MDRTANDCVSHSGALTKDGKNEENAKTVDERKMTDKDITNDLRNRVIVKLFQAILPRLDVTLVRDTRTDKMIEFVRKLETEVYMQATDRINYFEMLQNRIMHLRKQLHDAKAKRSGKMTQRRDVNTADAALEDLTSRIKTIDIGEVNTIEVPFVPADTATDEDDQGLTAKGPNDGQPVHRQNQYSCFDNSAPRFQQGSKTKRLCNFDYDQSSIYRRPTREPEENDEFVFMQANNVNESNKLDSLDWDAIFTQPESPETLYVLEQLNDKVCGRTRHYSAIASSPSSSSDVSAMSPQSTTTEPECFDPKTWSTPNTSNYNQQMYSSDQSAFSQVVPSPGLVTNIGSPYSMPSPNSVYSAPSPSTSTSDLDPFLEQDYLDVYDLLKKECLQIDRKNQQYESQCFDDGLQILERFANDVDARKKPVVNVKPITVAPVLKKPMAPVVQRTQTIQFPVTTVTNTPITSVITIPLTAAAVVTPVTVIQANSLPYQKNGLRPILPKPVGKDEEDKKKMPPPNAPVSTLKTVHSPKSVSSPKQANSPAKNTGSLSSQDNSHRPVIDRQAIAFRRVAELGVDQLTAQDEDGDTALMICACRGDPTTVEAICVRSSREPDTEILNQQNKMDQTALYLAVSENHPAIVKILVLYRANVNLAAKVKASGIDDKLAPIHVAAQHGEGHCEVLKELLRSNEINLDIPSRVDGMTALHWAAKRHGKIDNCGRRIDSKRIVQELLAAGARPDAQEGKGGKTPLHLAVESMDSELVRCIILGMSRGIVDTINKPMFDGNTCLHIAAGLNNCTTGNVMSLNQQRSIVDVLLKHGANKDAKNRRNDRPRNYARSREIQALLGGQPVQLQQNFPTPLFRYQPQVNANFV